MNDMPLNDIAMLVLIGVIVVFVILLMVLIVHFISTVRKVNRTIDDIRPTIETANKMLEEIQPALKRVDPLIERVSLTVDAVNLEIMRADTILADISEVTSTASTAVGKVAEITDAPLNLLNAATDKVRDLFGSSREKRDAEKAVRRSAEKNASEDETVVEGAAALESESAPGQSSGPVSAEGMTDGGPTPTDESIPAPEAVYKGVPEPLPTLEPEPAEPEPLPVPAPFPTSDPVPQPEPAFESASETAFVSTPASMFIPDPNISPVNVPLPDPTAVSSSDSTASTSFFAPAPSMEPEFAPQPGSAPEPVFMPNSAPNPAYTPIPAPMPAPDTAPVYVTVPGQMQAVPVEIAAPASFPTTSAPYVEPEPASEPASQQTFVPAHAPAPDTTPETVFTPAHAFNPQLRSEFTAEQNNLAQQAAQKIAGLPFTEFDPVEGAQRATAPQLNYTPDFEPDDDIGAPKAQASSATANGSSYLFYTDESATNNNKPKE